MKSIIKSFILTKVAEAREHIRHGLFPPDQALCIRIRDIKGKLFKLQSEHLYSTCYVGHNRNVFTHERLSLFTLVRAHTHCKERHMTQVIDSDGTSHKDTKSILTTFEMYFTFSLQNQWI